MQWPLHALRTWQDVSAMREFGRVRVFYPWGQKLFQTSGCFESKCNKGPFEKKHYAFLRALERIIEIDLSNGIMPLGTL